MNTTSHGQRFGYQRTAGLTLVELMVVVAVLSILAGIAYPLYSNQAQKARRADAKVALETIALAQERIYTIQGSYATALSNSTLQLSPALSGGDSEDGYYTVTLTSVNAGQGFTLTATAAGAQADDSDCASFTINHTGQKTATDANSTNCW